MSNDKNQKEVMPDLPNPSLAQHRLAAVDVCTDVALAASVCAGHVMAFELVTQRYSRLLVRAARGVVGDDAEAQDVVQEAYLHAFTQLQSYRGDAARGTWLARIAINIGLNSRRKMSRLVQWQDDDSVPGESVLEDEVRLHASILEAPDAIAERNQVRALLQSSIESLPVIYRAVFILRAVEEMSVEETAFCLSVSASVVKTRLLRARGMLRDTLGRGIEARAPDTFDFAGLRCDSVVNHVMARLGVRGLRSTH